VKQSINHFGYLDSSSPGSLSLTSGTLMSRDILCDNTYMLLLVGDNNWHSVLDVENYGR
jgi:hypothetical protein